MGLMSGTRKGSGLVTPNVAFERSGSLSSRARVRRVCHFAPSARLIAQRQAAQRERQSPREDSTVEHYR
jgi:hypothetical protein